MSLPVLLSYEAVAVSFAVVLVLRLRSALRGMRGAGEGPLDLYETAFLAGGPGRAADVALYSMHGDGRIGVDERGRMYVMRPEARDAVERELLDRCGPTEGVRLSTLRPALMRSAPVQGYGDALARRGLLLRPEAHRRRRRAALAHYAVCATAFFILQFGAPGAGSPASAPWEVPAVLPVVAAVVCFLLTPGRSRVSPAGRAWLRKHAARWRNSGPAAGAVAIDGAGAVRDTILRYELRRAAGGRRGSPSSSSSSHSAGGSDAGVGAWCGTSGSGCGTSTGCGSGSGGGCGGGCGGGGGGGGGCGSN